ncbi:hypothetical protein [Azospirillum argentinense]
MGAARTRTERAGLRLSKHSPARSRWGFGCPLSPPLTRKRSLR